MPWVDENECIGCGVCVDECPADALSLVEGIAKMDIAMCIRCGVCHEVCPEEAVKHDSLHIPIDVEANVNRAREAMARDFFDSEEQKQGCLQRWMNLFNYQKKVAEQTLEALEALKKG